MAQSRYSCEGLPTGDLLISDIREEVSETTVCSYFGPKSSKSGWKYTAKCSDEEQAQILSLYRRVYETDEPPNKEITLSFARGLICMSLGRNVNWAQFAAERRKVREALRKKSEDRKEKREREREGDERKGNFVSVLGKKRCTVGKEGLGFPESLTLSVKSEGIVKSEGVAMAKKGSKGRSGVCGPCWGRDEIESMVRAIKNHEVIAQESKTELAESRAELLALEDKLRREKLLLGDRELMLGEVQMRLERLSEEELPLQCSIEAKKRNLVEFEQNSDLATETSVVKEEIAKLLSERDALSFSKASDQLTVRLCGEAIVGCNGAIKELQCRVLRSSEKNALIETRVSSLESVLMSMREQLSRMHVGDGAALYPRPLESSPQLPVSENHTLNACPVCSLWYECFDYASLACGHTYHPYCLYEYAQKAEVCLFGDCHEPFAAKTLTALGIRPSARLDVATKLMRSVKEEVAGKSSEATRSGATTDATTSPTSSWGKDSPEKITPLSQSSQTDVTSKQLCFVEPAEKTTSTPTCEVCKTRDASVYIKACGHDVFCFVCIQGLQSCPVCAGRVTGWGRNNAKSTPTPLLDLTDDRVERNTESIVEPSKEDVDEVQITVAEGREDELEACIEDLSSGSDTDNGLVKWCGPEEFRNGGTRSRQHIEEAEEDQSEGESDRPATPGPRNSKRFSAVSTLLESGGIDAELESTSVGRKRSRSKHPTAGHMQKFKKIVEMAAEEILGPVPGADMSGTGGATDIEPTPKPRKRNVGRPPSASKLQGQRNLKGAAPATKIPADPASTTLALQKVVQLRSTLRRREVQETVPVKFRGM
ncbi:hypothetical protein KC19_9G090800 [Ceratodon purpureus]|uniref:RING-type domain-containing protein n=1 Tax=Ceratodon purpureus TaxID=3225 RepID=A0A8T0GS73_CERPU|nr:hypothetical protein KC19_9G090800 [Ceratodon purpureus]